MKTFITAISALLLIPALVFGQAEQSDSSMDLDRPNIFEQHDVWGVGAHVGLLSGMGLGVRYHPQGRIGFQLAGGVISLGDETPFSIGGEFQFDFDAEGRSRFYGLAGVGYYDNGAVDDENTPEKDELEEDKLDAPLRIGIGVAYEWDLSAKLVFNANLAFTYFTDGIILPLPQFAIVYYFN